VQPKTIVFPVLHAAALVLVPAAGSLAQGVRLELRIVPQTGSPVTVVEDLPGSLHTPVIGSDPFRSRRFEIQYRLIDTDAFDAVTPFGLQATRINITSSRTDSISSLSMEPAFLSRFEAQNNRLATPPAPRDTSGPNTSSFSSRGLHTPFRGGFTFPDFPQNGILSTAPDGSPQITAILPTSNIVNDQYSVPGTVNGDAAGDWYGLYSFYIQAGTPSVDTQITVTASLSSELGPASFAWFPSDGSEPRIAFQSASASAGVMVLIPAPSAALALLPMFLAATRRRRT